MNEEERFDDIVARFEKMLKTNESYFFDLNDFLDIIDEYITLADYHMALKAVEIGLHQHRDNVDILLYKAEIYSFLDQLEKAEMVIAYIKQLEPDRLEIPMLEAELYSRSDKHLMAVEALKRALPLAEDKAEVYEMLTIEYFYLENYREALLTAHKTLQFDADNATALYNAITCYDLLDKTGEAIVFLEKHVDENPFSEVGWSLLGKKYLDTRDYEKALKALDYAIAIDDRFIGAYYDKAFAHTRLGNYDQAITCYERTLAISDPTAFAYYHIGKVYELMQSYAIAANYYLKALDEDPGHYKSWKKLIRIKMFGKEYESALDLTNKAIEIANNSELYNLQALIFIKLNQIYKAIASFETAMKLGNADLQAILMLSDLYKQTQQIDKFRNLLLEAKKRFPDSKEIQQRMQQK